MTIKLKRRVTSNNVQREKDELTQLARVFSYSSVGFKFQALAKQGYVPTISSVCLPGKSTKLRKKLSQSGIQGRILLALNLSASKNWPNTRMMISGNFSDKHLDELNFVQENPLISTIA